MMSLLGVACPGCRTVWAGLLPDGEDTVACPICLNVIDIKGAREWISLGYDTQKKQWEAVNGVATEARDEGK